MVDHSQPHPVGFDARNAIFEKLFLDLNSWLGNGKKGKIIFDRNAPGPVVHLYETKRKHRQLRFLPHTPAPADSLDHFELRVADLSAYFLLQKFSAGATQILKAGAKNAIDPLSARNLLADPKIGVGVEWL
jgi:hypothetical protein